MQLTPRDRPDRRARNRRVGLVIMVLAVLVVAGVALARGLGDDDTSAGPAQRTGASPSVASTPAGSSAAGTVTPSPSPSPTPSAGGPPDRAGISFGSALYALSARDLDRALDDVVALRMRWIRIDLSWAGIQPLSASRYDWSAVDAVVEAASERKLTVLGLLTYTPPWARAAGCGRFSCPPRRTAQFATFAATAVRRYAPQGVRTYQLWNAPNITEFWRTPDPVAYGALLRAATTAMRDAADGLRVIFGSLAYTGDNVGGNTGGNTGNIDAARFLRRACAAGNCRVDAVGYDPYTYPRLPSDDGSPLSAWQRIANPAAGAGSLRNAMTATGLARTTVWVTGFGAPTTYRGATDDRLVSERRQAAILRDGVRLAGASPTIIGGFFVNTLRDDPAAGPLGGRFGLIRSDGSRKPAFGTLAAALRR